MIGVYCIRPDHIDLSFFVLFKLIFSCKPFVNYSQILPGVPETKRHLVEKPKFEVMRVLILSAIMLNSLLLLGQVSINNSANPPDPSSMLDVSDPNRGLLIPRMTMIQRDGIALPANALLIYQTDNNPGFYYNQGTPVAPVWVNLAALPGIVHLEDRTPIDSLPYDISIPGSYYVTAHLTGMTGINITTSNVTLDLNGYTIKGLLGNTSQGIEITAAASNLHVMNGGITHWGREGIKAGLATNSSFTQLRLLHNTYDGIVAGNNNLISFVVAANNNFDGIDMGKSAVIYHCTAVDNLNDGIEADAGSSLMNCTSRNNSQNGIRTTGSSTVSNSACIENDNHGFFCGTGSVVRQNTATNNSQSGFYMFSSNLASENLASSNGHHGFEWLNDCVLTDNEATLNTYSGFSTTYNGGRLENNVSSSNLQHGFAISNSGGLLIIRNTASGNGINAFNVMPGNTFASVITSATINTNTNPNANFQL